MRLVTIYHTDTIAPAEMQAYIAGIKAYTRCLREHGVNFKIAAAAARTKWPYYWDAVAIDGGGDGAPHYQLAIGGKNWADVGTEPHPALWKMVANA